MISVNLQTRVAIPEDQKQIANLMFFESHVHRHLDWRAPLDWLGSPFYWVLEENARVQAVLACPQEPPGVAWVRLFAHAADVSLADAWQMLWDTARSTLAREGSTTIAAICMHEWLAVALEESEFVHTQDIVMLELHDMRVEHALLADGIQIRNMTQDDLPGVARLDAAAFMPLWQNPLSALTRALPQASVATVAEDDQGLVGYQIATANPFGAHLARLAVRPDAQNRRLGSHLVADLIARLHVQGTSRLTVNTQSDNFASLALYKKIGFAVSGEQFPVYSYEVFGV
jgi:ribosomal-protein-alanine N-acetyltransferase